MTTPMRIRLNVSATPDVILRRNGDALPHQWEGMVARRPAGGVVELVDNRFGHTPRKAFAKPTGRAEVERDGTVREVWLIEWGPEWQRPVGLYPHAH